MLHRRGRAVVLHGPHAGVEIEDLPERDVQRANTAPDRRSERSLDADTELANGGDGIIGKPIVELRLGFFACKDLVPCDLALAVISTIYRCVEHTDRSFPDIAAGAITLYERNDRMVRHIELPVLVIDLLSARRERNSVKRHCYLQETGAKLRMIRALCTCTI